ncbi:MAG TPA: hypothetical protein VGE21_10085 [Flavobacteriales bacterium]
MAPIARNIIALVVGAAACIILNGLVLGVMMKLVPPPEGFIPEQPATYGLLATKHYLAPFLAHALPSFIGGYLAAWIAATRRMTFALAVGALHLLGGIAAAFLIPAPAWFIVVDLVLAYLPMAWLGGRLALRRA